MYGTSSVPSKHSQKLLRIYSISDSYPERYAPYEMLSKYHNFSLAKTPVGNFIIISRISAGYCTFQYWFLPALQEIRSKLAGDEKMEQFMNRSFLYRKMIQPKQLGTGLYVEIIRNMSYHVLQNSRFIRLVQISIIQQ